MMPLHLRRNPYQGINAHLHSRLQDIPPGGRGIFSDDWHSFHTSYLVNVADALNDKLPEGYIARAQKSLQIRVQEGDSDSPTRKRPEPDITIWQQHPLPAGLAASLAVAEPQAVIDHIADIDQLYHPTKAVVIFADDQPITRIELLSPANKRGGSHHHSYLAARNVTLSEGQALIELDFLHETPFPMDAIPAYPDINTAPYHIVISNPRQPAPQVWIYAIHVDEGLPIVPVPLGGASVMPFDFGGVYQQTFWRGRWGSPLDYAQPPVHLERYNAADRQRIQHLMATLDAAQAAGLDLETMPNDVHQDR